MIALFWLFLAVSVSLFKSKNRLAAENAALRHHDVAFDLFRRLAGVLRDDVDERRDRVWISFDVQSSEGTPPAIMTSTKNATMSARIRSEKAMMAFMDQARRARLQFTHLRAEGSISLIRRKKSCPQRGQRKLCL
jgi:hypothetical protein